MRDVAYVALGSNVGDRDGHLRAAREHIATIPATRVLAETVVEETSPIGPPGQGAYLNQMAAYVAVLRGVYPGRRVEAALLWTDGPKLMPVPDEVVESTLAALRAG